MKLENTMNTKQMMPKYKVHRNFVDPNDRHYVVTVDGQRHRIRKVDSKWWYARTRYFRSLRDAIIYCAFGAC